MKTRIPQKTVTLWQLRITIISLIPIVSLCFLSYMTKWLLLAALVFTTVFLVAVFWYIPMFLKSYELFLKDGVVIINRGVYIRTSHIMPFSRLIYTSSFSTPVTKRLGLTGLSLKAARKSLFIPELTSEDFETFVNLLTEEAEE